MAKLVALLVCLCWQTLAMASTVAETSTDTETNESAHVTANADEVAMAPGETPAKGSKKEQREARRAEVKAKVDALLARDPEQADYSQAERCISTARIRDVDVLDSQHVAFRVKRNEYYLVQFERRCPGLRRGQIVQYESNSSRLCTFDSLRGVYNFGRAGLQPGVKCFIPGFQSVTKEQVDSLRVMLKNQPRGS